MWARRCGAPPRWPSRLKVIFLSIGTAAIGLAIYQFMAGGDVGYLDISKPVPDEVLCLTKWPLRNQPHELFDRSSWEDWARYRRDSASYMRDHACEDTALLSAAKANKTCKAVNVPLEDMQRSLGVPISRQIGFASDTMLFYAHGFLFLSAALWLAINCHDLSLIHVVEKDYVLDLGSVWRSYPALRRTFDFMGLWLVCRIAGRGKRGIILVVLTAPLVVAWSVLVFVFGVCPLATVIFIVHPVRMSRLWTFLLCLLLAIFGLILTLHQILYIAKPALRAQFAVTWAVADDLTNARCVCGCNYRLSVGKCLQLALIGALTTVKSILVALRCLKGLRRSNWANLMSVTFAVPVTAYAVEWTEPDGRPIKHRKEGQPVQSELAFDPFAMMDEQPNSARTTVTLRPTALSDPSESRQLQGPTPKVQRKLTTDVDIDECTQTEFIGCCGFPFRTGGVQARVALPSKTSDSFAILAGDASLDTSVVAELRGDAFVQCAENVPALRQDCRDSAASREADADQFPSLLPSSLAGADSGAGAHLRTAPSQSSAPALSSRPAAACSKVDAQETTEALPELFVGLAPPSSKFASRTTGSNAASAGPQAFSLNAAVASLIRCDGCGGSASGGPQDDDSFLRV